MCAYQRLDVERIRQDRKRGWAALGASAALLGLIVAGMVWVQLNTHVRVVTPNPGAPMDMALWDEINRRAPTERIAAALREKPHLAFIALPNGRTPLHVAASDGRADVASLLLDRQAEPNAMEQDGPLTGFTPLHAAAAEGHAEVVRLLLSRGAKPGLEDARGKTALDVAERAGHAAVVEILRPVTPPRK